MGRRPTPLIVYANFFSDVAVDLSAHEVLVRWARQAPREIWLTSPGDVLVTPTPLSDAFLRYVCGTLGMPYDSVTAVTVPQVPGATMADAVRRAGQTELLRALAARRPGVQLLPLALDTATVGLAEQLGVPIAPYGPSGAAAEALEVVYRLNTKTGFRALAEELGIRMPPGRVCDGRVLGPTADSMLDRYERVVAKPDRSAAGQGLMFLVRGDTLPHPGDGPGGTWVVERWLDVARSVSVQMETLPSTGPRVVFSGEMRTSHGAYAGYLSPLHGVAEASVAQLERWGTAVGKYLWARGYAGSYAIDGVVAADGTLYATESNVRRTATTTPGSMVRRLLPEGLRGRTWLLGAGRSASTRTFDEATRLLRSEGLAWHAGRAEGAVLYEEATADDPVWRYALIGACRNRVDELESAVTRVLALDPPVLDRAVTSAPD
ncbi:peptide ligase PGM1-related protein [Streptomyces sp. NBC_01619]|uniref:preATP grasp domain-containing protein n=1 Tax=Streptomyces sp. NBC_01619 TaxID=2975901 RepID=UPI0022512BB5|nr:peptide ligase PGM1-related protein [Streptomyces sp. NBC_01619]MCX4513815.1 peptide ligase PGM1-related protein [Streptomyces sp. NBC_01619]